MKLTSQQKMIIVAALVVVVAALAVIFVIMPQFTQLADLQTQKDAANARAAAASGVLETLRAAKGRAAITQAELLQIGTQMPDSPQLPSLIIELQDIANASGVKVTSMAPGQPVVAASGQYTEVAMSTQVTAEWDDLLDYLKRLDHSTRLLRVTNLTVNPPVASSNTTGTAASTALSVTMTMKTYVIGNNGVVSATATQTAGTP
ncbi:MAG TPA: type 4a pilus biogenesis protein PilO [Propionibacteriaceae bacterium]